MSDDRCLYADLDHPVRLLKVAAAYIDAGELMPAYELLAEASTADLSIPERALLDTLCSRLIARGEAADHASPEPAALGRLLVFDSSRCSSRVRRTAARSSPFRTA